MKKKEAVSLIVVRFSPSHYSRHLKFWAIVFRLLDYNKKKNRVQGIAINFNTSCMHTFFSITCAPRAYTHTHSKTWTWSELTGHRQTLEPRRARSASVRGRPRVNADAGSNPRCCVKGFSSQSQLSVQTLFRCSVHLRVQSHALTSVSTFKIL